MLPNGSAATGCAGAKEAEIYNDGGAFKVTCRDHRGVIVTIIADNYFGYCKKEVKTQISFAANLYGLCEEEHAGGAIAFAYVLSRTGILCGPHRSSLENRAFEESMRLLGDRAEGRPEGYAVDRSYPDILYVPENRRVQRPRGCRALAFRRATAFQLRLRAGSMFTSCLPVTGCAWKSSPAGTSWRLVGTRSDSTLCHKPCTVSGGGKSEISKSISNAPAEGPVFVGDYQHDMDWLAADPEDRFLGRSIVQPQPGARAHRPLLSPERSLGSVIKLLTPSPEYTTEYNAWFARLSADHAPLVCTVKRYYRPEWGENWREHFSVDRINGFLGHELKFDNQKLVGNYLRVGFDPDGSWRIFKLRPGFQSRRRRSRWRMISRRR